MGNLSDYCYSLVVYRGLLVLPVCLGRMYRLAPVPVVKVTGAVRSRWTVGRSALRPRVSYSGTGEESGTGQELVSSPEGIDQELIA